MDPIAFEELMGGLLSVEETMRPEYRLLRLLLLLREVPSLAFQK